MPLNIDIPLLLLLLVLLASILIFAEFFLPGGVLGVTGGIFLAVAVVLVYIHYGFLRGTLALGGVAIFTVGYVLAFLKFFKHTFLARRLTLKSAIPSERAVSPAQVDLLGKTGQAVTPLRPSGKALIEGQRIEVLAETGLIESGRAVEVIRVTGANIIVRALSE